MSNWLQRKYIGFAGLSLRNFKWKNGAMDIAQFSCPYCGDSDSSKTKARGFMIKKAKGYYFFCHNCGQSAKFEKFMTDWFPHFASEYRLENLRERNGSGPPVEEAKKEVEEVQKTHLDMFYVPVEGTRTSIDYLASRRIPKKAWSKLGHTENFFKFCEDVLDPKLFKSRYTSVPPDARLIIPFYKRNGDLFAFQGRAYDPKCKLRYVTVKIDEDYPKIFGLERLNPSNPTIVVEGPIDSLFLPNCCAMAGSDVSDAAKQNFFVASHTYMVYDNEPRNPDVVKKMEKAAKDGYLVHIWKTMPEELKDVNAMVMNGIPTADIIRSITGNSYSGLRALAEVKNWSKIQIQR